MEFFHEKDMNNKLFMVTFIQKKLYWPENVCRFFEAVWDDALEVDGGARHHVLLRITVHRNRRNYKQTLLRKITYFDPPPIVLLNCTHSLNNEDINKQTLLIIYNPFFKIKIRKFHQQTELKYTYYAFS